MPSKLRGFFAPAGGRTFFLWLLFLKILIFLSFSPFASAKTLSGKVVKIFDGDTFLVRVEGREEHVRLREIDAPEISREKQTGQEPWGRRAKEFAQSKVKGKTVRLEVEEQQERDKYQRLLAYVFLDHTFVNREMIISGNAFFYPGSFMGRHAGKLQEAEDLARKKEIGIFNKKNGLKERPQEFRRRTQRDESLFSRFRNWIRREEKRSPVQKYPVPHDKIVANKRSMVYHLPGSPQASRVSPQNRIYFDSPEEAEKAGFRRAVPTPMKNSMMEGRILSA